MWVEKKLVGDAAGLVLSPGHLSRQVESLRQQRPSDQTPTPSAFGMKKIND